MECQLLGRTAYAYTGGKVLDPALPCTVLVHGAIDDHSVWALQSRYLAHHGRAVLAVDLPGHGRSAGPALESIEALADWLVALLDAAGVRRSTLVGHSMGSLVSLEAAARLSQRSDHQLDGLVMVGTAYPMKVSAAMLETALKRPLRAIDMVNSFSHSTLAAKPSAPAPGFWLRGGAKALNRRTHLAYTEAGHGNLFHHDFSLCDRYDHALEAAAELHCPVRLVLGSGDVMTSPKATQGLALALKAEVLLLPAGHALMGEDPDGVLNAILGMPTPTPSPASTTAPAATAG